MSTRPNLRPYSVITSGNMSADITSEVTIIDNKTILSYQLTWSGTSPVGVAIVQVSNDYSEDASGNVKNSGTWSDLTSSAVSGNTGTGFFDIALTGAYAIRLFYDKTSGTGTLNATISAKVA